MVMAYKDIPLPTDTKSQSQKDIKENFLQINTLTSKDHEDFNSGAKMGKHKTVTFPEQGADPATLVGEIKVYSKNDGAATALYLRKENSGDVINFTFATAHPGAAVAGYCILPCGIKLNWGRANIGGGALGQAFVFASAFVNDPYSITVTTTTRAPGVWDDSVIIISAHSNAGATAARANPAHIGTGLTFDYFALGR